MRNAHYEDDAQDSHLISCDLVSAKKLNMFVFNLVIGRKHSSTTALLQIISRLYASKLTMHRLYGARQDVIVFIVFINAMQFVAVDFVCSFGYLIAC